MTAKPRRGLTEQAADAAVDQACRMLRLPTIRAQFPRAGRGRRPRADVLPWLPCRTAHGRVRRPRPPPLRTPHQGSRVPREKSLRSFDFDANPSIDPAVINTLATCDWVKKGLPLRLIGDSGTDKSHLLIALGTEAAMAGFRVHPGDQARQRARRGRR